MKVVGDKEIVFSIYEKTVHHFLEFNYEGNKRRFDSRCMNKK